MWYDPCELWDLAGGVLGIKTQLQIKQRKDLKPDQLTCVFLAILRGLSGVSFVFLLWMNLNL